MVVVTVNGEEVKKGAHSIQCSAITYLGEMGKTMNVEEVIYHTKTAIYSFPFDVEVLVEYLFLKAEYCGFLLSVSTIMTAEYLVLNAEYRWFLQSVPV